MMKIKVQWIGDERSYIPVNDDAQRPWDHEEYVEGQNDEPG